MKTPYPFPLLILLLSLFFMGNTSTDFANRKIPIKLDHVLQISNNGVGEQWSNFLSINKKVIKKGEELEVELKKRAPLVTIKQ